MTGITTDSISDYTRSISIFASYFVLCTTLLSLCLSTLRVSNFSRARGSWTFTILALTSLGSTWYYMIAFFIKSYNDWAALQAPSVDNAIQLGPWLKDVKLFEQAWATVIEEPARWWWSQQIFLATCGWTVFLAAEGSRRGIKHLWAFMALGQVVAISFAVNLFFLTIVLHDVSPSPPPKTVSGLDATVRKAKELPSWLYFTVTVPMAVSFLFSFLTPSTIGTRAFMPFLLIPHLLLLFVPALFESLSSRCVLELYLPANKFRGFWRPQYRFCALISAVCHNLAFRATAAAIPNADAKLVFAQLMSALYHHPAVSSVGWDVIMNAVSVGMWLGVCGGNFGMKPKNLRKGGDWVSAVVGWSMMTMGSVGMNALAFGGELGG